MCIIYACEEGRPSDKLLDRGWDGNEDGAGLMWYDAKEKVVKWEKGFHKIGEVKKRHRQLPLPYAIHFRNSSMGDGGIWELTHPFPITKDVEIVAEGSAASLLMHNGHWSDWNKMVIDLVLRHKIRIPDGVWSDSRAFAFLAFHLGEQFLPMMDRTDRFLILNADRGDGTAGFSYYGHWKAPDKAFHEKGFLMSTEVDKKPNYTSYSQGYGGYPKVSEAADGKSPLANSAASTSTSPTTSTTPTSGSPAASPVPASVVPGGTNTTTSAQTSSSTPSSTKGSGDTQEFALEELQGLMNELAGGGRVGHA